MALSIKRWEVETVKSVSAFIKLVEDQKRVEEASGNAADFIFRGQPVDKPLLPKLGRPPLHPHLRNREALMLEEFKRTSVGLTDIRPDSDWEFLALAQHHGLPTRLLDWTYGALTAMWFAVENGEQKDENGAPQNAVVWLLKTRVDDIISTEEQKTISPLGNEKTRIYVPMLVTRRIAVQGGLFTRHQIRAKTNDFVPLELNGTYLTRLVKFIVESADCDRMKKDVNGCGLMPHFWSNGFQLS